MARRLSEDAEPRPNVSPDLVAEAYRAIRGTGRDVKQAQSQHQTTVKRYKKQGVDTDILREVIRDKDKDPTELSAAMSKKLDYMRWCGIAVQLDMFGASKAEPTEKTKQAVLQDDALNEGYQHGLHGGTTDDCPYKLGTEEAVAWINGLRKGEAFLAQKTEILGEENNVTPISGRRGRRVAAEAEA
jgi:ribosome modulation factor